MARSARARRPAPSRTLGGASAVIAVIPSLGSVDRPAWITSSGPACGWLSPRVGVTSSQGAGTGGGAPGCTAAVAMPFGGGLET